MIDFVRNSKNLVNPKFRAILERLYRTSAVYSGEGIGNGSSFAALMSEARTGVLLSKGGHLQKVAEARNSLMALLREGSLSSFEQQFAIRQIVEANRALRVALQSTKLPTIVTEVMTLINKYPIK